jgi:hypothetical protein
MVALGLVALYYLSYGTTHGLSLSGGDLMQVSSNITEIRVVPFSTRDAGQAHTAAIYYRAEAHAKFDQSGRQYDEWLPASQVTSSRAELELWLSKTTDSPAIVYVSTKDPRVGIVRLTSKF